MKRWLSSLFSENGDVSAIRVMAMISLLIGGTLAFMGKNDCVGIFVGAAMAAKVSQKFIETKKSTIETTEIKPS